MTTDLSGKRIAFLVANVGVEEVELTRGVTVRAVGSRFYGAFGVGQETFGVLKMIGSDRQRPLGADQIDSRAARSVLAVGGTVNAAALTKAVQVGVRGIIAGAIESFLLVANGEMGIAQMIGSFFLPVLAGNIVGGTVLFALLSYAQVMKEI